MTSADDALIVALVRHRAHLRSVLPFDINAVNPAILDFSSANHALAGFDLNDVHAFAAYVDAVLEQHQTSVGLGRYNEDRVVYRHSPLFNCASERRSIHLGIDLFVAAGSPILAPLDGSVHSFDNNASLGDYGPTIVLGHELDGITFFTLYGHLSLSSLDVLHQGLQLQAGTEVGRLGGPYENGGWPAHLHFQLIRDMQDLRGDFPGVAAPSQRDRYLHLCPNPNLILGIEALRSS